MATPPYDDMGQTGPSLSRCTPKRIKEWATLTYDDMAQSGTSLTKSTLTLFSSKRLLNHVKIAVKRPLQSKLRCASPKDDQG